MTQSINTDILLEVRDLQMHYPITTGLFARQTGAVKAVDNVSFTIARGETLGLVGESGCGKTSMARSIVQLYKPTSGEVIFDGEDLATRELGHRFHADQDWLTIGKDGTCAALLEFTAKFRPGQAELIA